MCIFSHKCSKMLNINLFWDCDMGLCRQWCLSLWCHYRVWENLIRILDCTLKSTCLLVLVFSCRLLTILIICCSLFTAMTLLKYIIMLLHYHYSTSQETWYWLKRILCIWIITFWHFNTINCCLSCSPFWSIVHVFHYCGFGKPFEISHQKLLVGILKVCCELTLLVYMPVLFGMTFVIVIVFPMLWSLPKTWTGWS